MKLFVTETKIHQRNYFIAANKCFSISIEFWMHTFLVTLGIMKSKSSTGWPIYYTPHRLMQINFRFRSVRRKKTMLLAILSFPQSFLCFWNQNSSHIDMDYTRSSITHFWRFRKKNQTQCCHIYIQCTTYNE